jgi:hypothetical protein
VEEFQSGTLALIQALPGGTGVFSPTCLVHCLSGQTKNGQTPFTQLQSAGTSLAASLSAWYFLNEDVLAVSDCIGWQCTQACGVDMRTGLPCNMGADMQGTQECSAISVMVPDQGATTSSDEIGKVDSDDVAVQMHQVQAHAAQNVHAYVHAREGALSSEQAENLAALIGAYMPPAPFAPDVPPAPSPPPPGPPPPGPPPPLPAAVAAAQEQMKLRMRMQQQAAAQGVQQGGEGGAAPPTKGGSAGASRRMLRAAAASCCGAEGAAA